MVNKNNKRDYYIKNRDKILQNKKDYYKKNKEKLKEKMRIYGTKWYKENKEKIQKLHREYYKNNKEKESQRYKKIYQRNKEEILEKSKEYYWKNRDEVCYRHRKYNKEHKEKLLQYKGRWQKHRRKTNPKYRLDENMGRAVWACLKNKKSGQGWESLVGYALKDLIKHLEKQFDGRINWDNYGNYWAVDHIKPKSLFVYGSPDDLEFKECWSLKNLQPLEKIENIKKRNHYTEN